MRWRLWLMEFDYEIFYRPGSVHQVPGALSRVPRPEKDNEDVPAEIEETIPTFKKDFVEIIVGVVTRTQSQSEDEQVNE